MANIEILVGEKVQLSIVPTLNRADADIIGIPTWVAATPAAVHLYPSEDGRTCIVTGKAVGSSVVTVTALGASSITANHTVVVSASNLATALAVTVERFPIDERE